MDTRLRELERQAAAGDPRARERLIIARCRAYGHDWEEEQRLISTFPVIYHRFQLRCKRCEHPNHNLEADVRIAETAARKRHRRRPRRRGPKKKTR